MTKAVLASLTLTLALAASPVEASPAAALASKVSAAALSAAPRGHRYIVQFRQIHWQKARRPNAATATALANVLMARGFQVRVRQTGSHYTVAARLPNWHTIGVTLNPAYADFVRRVLIAQKWQSRIVVR
jgi:hypothetical protein